MNAIIPPILLTHLGLFQSGFSKPNFLYFQGYLWSLLLTKGHKCMTNIASVCFFVERHLSSWERFLAENNWDLTALSKNLVRTLIATLGDSLKVHGAYLATLDTTLIAKARGQMVGVQKWKLATLLDHFQPEVISAFLYGETVQLVVVLRDVFLRDVRRKVRVVVVEGIKEPLIFLCTDLSLAASQIIEIYGARFSIECSLRTLKRDLGLKDYQCTTFQAILRFVHLACTALCLFRLILLKEDTYSMAIDTKTKRFTKEGQLSLSTLRRRFQAFAFKRILFSKSAPDADLKKGDAKLEQLLKIAS